MSYIDPAPTSPVSADNARERAVLHGLAPRTRRFEDSPETTTTGLRKTFLGSLPFLMTGTLAAGVGVAPDALQNSHRENSDLQAAGTARDDTRPGLAQRLSYAMLPMAHSILAAVRPDLPATYTVQSGDTVSSIADAFGIPTPAVLTLNGLSWNSLVHEGQILKLSAEPTKKRAGSPVRLADDEYTVTPGESISAIAARLGISAQALLAHNSLEPDSTIYAGQLLRVPGVTVSTVARQAPATMPALAGAPVIIAVSEGSESSAPDEDAADDAAIAPFDAADLPLAEKPALITVQVPKAAPAPKPPTPKPAPVSQANTPAPTPAPAEPSSSVGQPVAGSITPLSDERRGNAQIIVAVGRELGVPDYGIVIALATAMQESSLRNINWGDRDSVGLYQQRPSSGWGTVEQIMDQGYATRLFFGGPQNPNKGKTRGLLDISGWQNMALTDAAQRVQISAYPQAYAKWEASAWAWLYELS